MRTRNAPSIDEVSLKNFLNKKNVTKKFITPNVATKDFKTKNDGKFEKELYRDITKGDIQYLLIGIPAMYGTSGGNMCLKLEMCVSQSNISLMCIPRETIPLLSWENIKNVIEE